MSNVTTPELVPLPTVITTLAFSIIGFITNGLIIVSSIISPTLKNRCGILICILAIADFTVCSYLIHLRVMMLRKWYFVENIECYFHSIYGLFALSVQAGMGLIIGIDRLFAVSLPIRYSRLPRFLYIMMMGAVIGYAVLMTAYGYWDSSEDKVPVCLPPTAFNRTSRGVWIGSNVAIAFMVIVVYGLAHMKCRMLNAKNTHEQSIERIRKLLNSLSIVMAIYTSTWFVTVIALLVTQLFPIATAIVNEINQQLGWLVIINASMNFFIYFNRAPEYRLVYRLMAENT
ncbi:7 transmembrane receptor [Oesophagostomum dentatum]|uniref:7 transmembrane receptor n=1 Tax=Oesophagostomum dentatum TaxID=61180 RepID=A0A0B1TTC0_OESDE|nr:7 transmembrane receptor [Oesophagostomum dentatum]